jgi:hypothetical protein
VGQDIHYEIFRRQGAKGGWTMHEAVSNRDAALKIAEELMKTVTGVKVIKETYNPDTGDFLTLKIFEEGQNKVKVAPAAEDVPHALPCFQPDDLYSYHARSTIARLLADFLARSKMTATELMHRADALEKLEATGTQYQHAIQKVAVAQASSTTTPVQQIIKSLNDLVTKSIHRVYRDEREKKFPDVPPGRFGALATKLGESPGPHASYILNGAIAKLLAPAVKWDEKLALLLSLMADAPTDPQGRTLLLSSIDMITAQILNGSAALHELIGTQENLGEALLTLVQVFTGNGGVGGEGVTTLSRHFKADELPEARTAVANRIMAELKSHKRLTTTSITDELKLLRRVANKLVVAQGKYLAHEDIIAAFTLRSKRLVTNEVVATHLADAKEPDERLERLMIVEENIIGGENKRALVNFVMPILQSNQFEAFFQNARTPALARVQRLAELQTRVRRSGFQDKEKREINEILDKVAADVETRGKVLETCDGKSNNVVERAIWLLQLCTSGGVTEGKVSAKAREMIIASLSRPGFLTGYVAVQSRDNPAEKPDANTAMKELIERLAKAGITAETGLKSIAA